MMDSLFPDCLGYEKDPRVGVNELKGIISDIHESLHRRIDAQNEWIARRDSEMYKAYGRGAVEALREQLEAIHSKCQWLVTTYTVEKGEKCRVCENIDKDCDAYPDETVPELCRESGCFQPKQEQDTAEKGVV